MTITPRLLLASLLLMSMCGSAAAQRSTRTPAPTPSPQVPTIWSGAKPPIGLQGGAPSIDALLDRLLAAIKAGDTKAMHALRLSKVEYTNIIVPGEVPKGQPPRATFASVNDTFHGMLDTKSRYAADAILTGFKGKDYVSRELVMSEPTREFAWYTAHGEVRLTLVDAQGSRHLLRTGWIAEVDGQFKFIGFNWDD